MQSKLHSGFLTEKQFLRKSEADGHFVKSRLIVVGNWLAPILSSLLLIGSTLILYSIQNTWHKLLAMIPITIAFSLIIKLFTSASRAEIFVAVAGYVLLSSPFITESKLTRSLPSFVAVEVVFVGNVS